MVRIWRRREKETLKEGEDPYPLYGTGSTPSPNVSFSLLLQI
jgi:hypothetical protein